MYWHEENGRVADEASGTSLDRDLEEIPGTRFSLGALSSKRIPPKKTEALGKALNTTSSQQNMDLQKPPGTLHHVRLFTTSKRHVTLQDIYRTS
jgi:hypothetical protein